jgi:GNAT superfamily N-acetyltransferase
MVDERYAAEAIGSVVPNRITKRLHPTQAQGSQLNQPDIDCCERLAWDSEFFGIEIGRVRTKHLSPAILEATDRWCAANATDCLYFLGAASDALTIRCAEDFGFELVDIRTTLARRINQEEEMVSVPKGSTIRLARPTDLESLRAIARSSYHDSRFYFDGRFPVEKCDCFYETWLEKSCADRTGVVLVAEWQGRPVGYVTCNRVDAATGQIGLIASSVHSIGLGRALVSSAIGWFRHQGFNRAQVVTQGRNVRAQALYQRCGFVTESVELWYHRWFDGSCKGRDPHPG